MFIEGDNIFKLCTEFVQTVCTKHSFHFSNFGQNVYGTLPKTSDIFVSKKIHLTRDGMVEISIFNISNFKFPLLGYTRVHDEH